MFSAHNAASFRQLQMLSKTSKRNSAISCLPTRGCCSCSKVILVESFHHQAIDMLIVYLSAGTTLCGGSLIHCMQFWCKSQMHI